MNDSLEIAALAVIAAGLLLVIVGIVFSWKEYVDKRELAAAEFLEKLAALVSALAGQSKSVVCFTFGVVLIFIGGLMAGATSLAA